jgi:hypothetical protein
MMMSSKKSNITERNNEDMAILGIFTGQGFTKQMYEDLKREVDWEHNPPAGVILHAAGLDKSGNIQVADLWQSEQDFNNFVNTRLKAGFDKINAPMPNGELYQVHNVNAFQGIDSYKTK